MNVLPGASTPKMYKIQEDIVGITPDIQCKGTHYFLKNKDTFVQVVIHKLVVARVNLPEEELPVVYPR